MLTVQDVAQALPAQLKTHANQQLVDMINNATTDPIAAAEIRNNFVSYISVLQEGKFKTEDYLNAVMYCSYKLMGMSNQDAYFKTFPQRHQALLAKGTSTKDISSYVSIYNKGKLVGLIMAQCLVPTWVLNHDIFQQAINTQADLMLNSASDMVRTQAANSLLTHLAKPKEAGPLVNINMQDSSGMNELKNMLGKLATQQVDLIASGVSPKQIADQNIMDVKAKDVTR